MNKNNWHFKLKEICDSLNYEYMIDGTSIHYFCPKLPSENQKKQIQGITSESYQHNFIEGPKNATMHAVSIIVLRTRLFSTLVKIENKKLILDSGKSDISDTDIKEMAETINRLLKKDGYFEEWVLILNDKEYYFNLKIAQAISQNKEKDSAISESDILDLKITLNDPSMTWDKLISML